VTAAPKSLYRRLESLLEGLPEGALVDDARACEALLERLRGELGTDALALLREDPAGFVLLAESGSGLEEPARGAEGWPAGVTVVPQERRRAATGGEQDELSQLTAQERKILLLVAEGKTNKEIAGDVFLSDKTVKNYVSSILSKLEVARRAEAAAYLARHTTTPGSVE